MNQLSINGSLGLKLVPLSPDTGTVALKGGTLVDGAGSPPANDAVVVIEGERIQRVGSTQDDVVPRDDGTRIIDVTGKVLIPGLFDCHIHLTGVVTFDAYRRYLMPSEEVKLLQAAVDAGTMLETGFTTLRDVGGKHALSLKQAIKQKVIVGPRIHVAGPSLTVTGGHGDWFHFPYDWVKQQKFRGWPVDGVDECRKAVRLNFRQGADLTKIIASGGGITNTAEDLAAMGVPEFHMEELEAIVSETHLRGGRVAAHTTGTVATQQALAAGVDTIEHGFLDPNDHETLDTMAEKQVSLIPTLSVLYRAGYEGDEMGVWEGGQEAGKRFLEKSQEMVATAKERGVNIALGTDGVGHMGAGRSALELRFLVESGLSAMEAIVAGTRNSAIALGLAEDVGTIEVGKLADVLVLEEDPLQDITVLEDKATIVHILKSEASLGASH